MHEITYCLLCKTIPEYSKQHQTLYTCSIGYSPELGLIRVYPLPPVGMDKWGIYKIKVERNKRDSRAESWKLSSYARMENWTTFTNDCIKIGHNKNKNIPMLNRYVYPSISELNKDRKSIGLIKANQFNMFWDVNDKFIDTKQIGLFEDVDLSWFASYTKTLKQKESRIVFNDMDGAHNLQYNEWGVYEFQRKFGANNDAFRYSKCSEQSHILVGNMHNYRSVWIALGIFDLYQELKIF